ncbi:MAG: 4-(cytidine 5'-diphospho)-2-C-methyl-D-erythritol kinase [Candidatus Woesearchaeota archaeon]|jgi:4-diphosphocytidyl-2-C-methyl-D-erythritol kinase|nr:4-(cytidine 5'-diphospho)-2-C-methyl-D-erythritol kinase [Candidatus Woesearchaeota archaeon]MDP6600350.1 4-(cytidine 5'-diphospho)-2-C-methyl-D-erythritol kinase [Candidatus Woesearchaeota archaeon]
MLLNSYAKINLYLKIGKKLKSDYHNLQSLMQQVQLHDNISFEKLNEDLIIVQSNNPDLESKGNLAYKAASLLKDTFKVKEGVRITLEKTIPMSAGLGGGSSNAANTLVTLNKLWDLNLSQKKLISLGAEIGSDVPFFVVGKTALVEGIGNKIKPLRKSISMNLVLVNPGIKVSTSWAYKQFDKNKPKEKSKRNVKDLINAISKKDFKKISENIHNDFDAIIEKKYSIIKQIKINLRKLDALSSLVSGSGPTVFGLYDSIYPAREAYFKLKDLYPFVYLTKSF